MFILFIIIKFISLDHQRLSDMHTKKNDVRWGMQRQRAVKKSMEEETTCQKQLLWLVYFLGWTVFLRATVFLRVWLSERVCCAVNSAFVLQCACGKVETIRNRVSAVNSVPSCYSNPCRRGAHRFPRVNSTFYGWAVISAWPVFLLQPTVWKICMSFICKATELRANGVLSGLSLWVI